MPSAVETGARARIDPFHAIGVDNRARLPAGFAADDIAHREARIVRDDDLAHGAPDDRRAGCCRAPVVAATGHPGALVKIERKPQRSQQELAGTRHALRLVDNNEVSGLGGALWNVRECDPAVHFAVNPSPVSTPPQPSY